MSDQVQSYDENTFLTPNNQQYNNEKQYTCDYIFEQEEPPVEYRLLQFNEIYKQRKEDAQNNVLIQEAYGSCQSTGTSNS